MSGMLRQTDGKISILVLRLGLKNRNSTDKQFDPHGKRWIGQTRTCVQLISLNNIAGGGKVMGKDHPFRHCRGTRRTCTPDEQQVCALLWQMPWETDRADMISGAVHVGWADRLLPEQWRRWPLQDFLDLWRMRWGGVEQYFASRGLEQAWYWS